MNVDKWITRGTSGTVILVAGFAAAVSYSHIRDLAIQNGYDNLTGSFLPLSVDGLLLGCSLLLMAVARKSLRASVAKFGMWLGVVATLCANVTYGLPHGVVGALVSAWPAAAFIVLIEAVLEVSKRKRKTGKTEQTARPTRRTVKTTKSAKTSNITQETASQNGSGGERDLGEAGSVEHKPHKRGRKSAATNISDGPIPDYDVLPTPYRIATDLGCGHAKSVQLHDIMRDDNVNLETALRIREERPIGERGRQYVEAQ